MAMSPEDLLKGMDDADELVQIASSIRNKFILSGWSTAGAESMTELVVANAMDEQASVAWSGDDDEDA